MGLSRWSIVRQLVRRRARRPAVHHQGGSEDRDLFTGKQAHCTFEIRDVVNLGGSEVFKGVQGNCVRLEVRTIYDRLLVLERSLGGLLRTTTYVRVFYYSKVSKFFNFKREQVTLV